MEMSSLQFKELYLLIAPERFHFLKFILEGYDGLAILSSVNGKTGVVRLRYPFESEILLFNLMSNIAAKINRYKQ